MIKRILLVDDDSEDKEILRQVIHQLDASIETQLVDNSAHVLDVLLLAAAKPDLIFLDLVMPGIDGIEFLTKLKANRSTKKIPVILYTSSDNVMEKKLALRLGALDVVSKTSNMTNLTERIKQLILLPQHH